MSWISRRAERQIAKATAEGALDHLPGAGKPLVDHPENAFVSASDAAGFRLMAAAGLLPQEITLKKAAAVQRAHLSTLTDPALRKAAMAKLAVIEMRQAIAEEARREFLR